MSLVRENLVNFIRLKKRQKELETEMQQIKKKLEYYEPSLTTYLTAERTPVDVNNRYRLSLQESCPHEPLTFKYLERCFSEVIPNEGQRAKLLKYIKDNRTRIYKQRLHFDFISIKNN